MSGRVFHLGPETDGAMAAYVAGLAHGLRRRYPALEQVFIPVVPPRRELPANAPSQIIRKIRGLAPVRCTDSEHALMSTLGVSSSDRIHIQFEASPGLSGQYLRFAAAAARSGARISLTAHRAVPDGLDHQSGPTHDPCSLISLADCICVHSSPVLKDLARLSRPTEQRIVQHAESYGDMALFVDAGGDDTHPAVTARASPEILFFGYLHDGKGAERLCESFRYVIQRRADVTLAIVGPCGDAQLRSRLINFARGLQGVSVRLEFVGTDDIPALFRRASLVALPYDRATQSSVLAWARATGVPAVLTDCPGFGDLWTRDHTGIYVYGSAPEVYGQGLLDVLGLKERLGSTLSEHIQRASAHQAWEQIAAELITGLPTKET